jgi:hypothetical protein
VIRRALLVVLAVGVCGAHDPITTKLTWTQEISRIVYKRCASCHHEGGRTPMSLLTYDDARPWAKAIRDEVLARRMPPWAPVKGFGDFRNDASLSEPEIEFLVDWVEGGAPKGDDVYLPPAPSVAGKSETPPAAERRPLAGVTTLSRDVTAVGIEPRGVVQVTAERPDGGIEPLIWVRRYKPEEQPKAYYFREAVKLPKGSRVRVVGGSVALLLARP